MAADYVFLAITAVIGIGGGMFLLSQAKDYRARHHVEEKNLPHQSSR